MSFDLLAYARTCQVPAPEAFVARCEELRLFLEEANKSVNLTRVTGKEDFDIKHAADSLAIAAMFPELILRPLEIADLGCGAGFPTLILAIAFPHWRITPVDSTGKKVDFVRRAAEHLQLNNVFPVHGRVNELNRKIEYKQRFDVVTARAVAPSDVLAQDASNFPAADGRFIFYKTPFQAEDEMPRLPKKCKGFFWSSTDVYDLPEEAGKRLFVIGKRNPSKR